MGGSTQSALEQAGVHVDDFERVRVNALLCSEDNRRARPLRRRDQYYGRACQVVAVLSVLVLAVPVANANDDWVPPANLTALRAQFHRPTEIGFPPENAYTGERELLGRTLFFDPRLSGSGVLACATCHNPSFGWGDGLRLGRGEGLQQLGRRTPTILNAAWGTSFFWDGRAPTLEAQASGPMGSPKEMNQNLETLPAKLQSVPGYTPLFDRAYPSEGISLATITKAIATFERTVASGRAPFDRWIDGDESALSASAKRGFVLFTGKANCVACHSGWAFTDNKFHDIGLADSDRGRIEVAPAEAHAENAFKTPTLRDVALRAPYMHNGSGNDLKSVIVHYAYGFVQRQSLSPEIRRFDLKPGDLDDMIAFLTALSAPNHAMATPTLPR